MSFFQPERRAESRAAKVSMALFRISQAIKKMTQADSTPHDLSPVQVQTLLFVQHTRSDMASIGNLAASIGATHATAVGIVNGLLAKGLVEKHAHPVDRRSTIVQLTAEGERVAQNLSEWSGELESALDEVPDELLSAFDQAVGAIAHSLNQRGYLKVAEPCAGCVYFQPNQGSEEMPHYCSAIERFLKHADTLKECPEHTPKP